MMGSLDREQALQFAHFLIWIAIRKMVQEIILVQENVLGFPRDTFLRCLPEYEFDQAVISPNSLGWPIVRERQWIVSLGLNDVGFAVRPGCCCFQIQNNRQTDSVSVCLSLLLLDHQIQCTFESNIVAVAMILNQFFRFEVWCY